MFYRFLIAGVSISSEKDDSELFNPSTMKMRQSGAEAEDIYNAGTCYYIEPSKPGFNHRILFRMRRIPTGTHTLSHDGPFISLQAGP